MKLVTAVSAHFEWLEPPKNTQEESMRRQADIMATAAAHRLRECIELLILQMLDVNSKPIYPKDS